jgi:hypothetical protein
MERSRGVHLSAHAGQFHPAAELIERPDRQIGSGLVAMAVFDNSADAASEAPNGVFGQLIAGA